MDTRDTVRMANQIGAFFGSYSETEALAGIAEHINKFWEPRMRREFFALIDKGGEGLSEIVRKAAAQVKRPAAA